MTATLHCELVINEIQYAPNSPEPEWVEIYNTSNKDLEISGFTVSDKINSSDPITLSIEAFGFAVITKDAAPLIEKYDLPTDNIYETNLPGLNNTNDVIKIATQGITYDSLLYDSKWGEAGKSLERINYFKSSNDNNNWGISTSTATPTKVNSIAKYLDIAIVSANLESNGMRLVVENNGNISTDSLSLGVAVNGNQLTQLKFDKLEAKSDNDYFLDFNDIGYSPKTNDKVELNINLDFDVNSTNNYYIYYIGDVTKQGDVLINELMYDIDESHFEFVEIYNAGKTEIPLTNWYIADGTDVKNGRYNLINTSTTLMPKEYAIIVSDSLAFEFIEENRRDKVLFTRRKLALNKSGDIICLFNEKKQLMDSLTYSNSWHESYLNETKNISLEKLQPSLESKIAENWKSCTDESGSTPLSANSYYQEQKTNSTISASPNPFSPSSSSEPYIVIEFNLPFESALLDCDVYYPSGAKAMSLIKSKFVSKSGIITWNGRDEGDSVLPIGPYVIYIVATNQSSGQSETLKTVIVLAK